MATIRDAIGEWWVYPLAISVPEEDRTVAGAIASNGEILACSIDHGTGETARVVVGRTQPDDHNCPSLWYAPGRRPVIMWTRHNNDRFIHCKVGTPDGDLVSLATAENQAGDAPGSTSYTQIVRIEHLSDDHQDTFWLMTRIGGANWHVRLLSVDQASGEVTWEPWQHFMQSGGQSYLIVAESHGEEQGIRLAWSYNPAQPMSAIRYLEINLVTGAITSPTDRALSADMYSGTGLPLIDTDVEPLLDEPPAHMSRRLFYARPGPLSAGVAYAEWDRDHPDEAVYKTTVRVGQGWETREHGPAGPRIGFTANANYLSGLGFPSPCAEDVVYATREVGGVSTVERITVRDGDQRSEVLMRDTARRWIRPAPPVGDPVGGVIAYEVLHYGEHFSDYEANLHYLDGAPDPGPATTVDRRIRILAGELRTGRVITELPVTDATWSMMHREPGEVSAVIPLTSPSIDKQRVQELVAATEGARCYLAAVAGNTVLEAGPVWVHDYQPDTGALSVIAKGLWSLFDHRYVMGPVDATPSDVNPWRRWEVTYQGLSLGTVAKRLIELSMSHTGGQLPVRLPPDQTGTHERTYYGYELATVYERVQQLMQVINGPDIAFRPRLAGGGLRVEWDMLVGDPILSQDGYDWVWDGAAPQSSVQGLTVRRDWTALATDAWATGSGQDKALLMRRATNEDLLAGGFPLVESRTSHASVLRGSTLQDHADSNARFGSRPWMTWGLEVRAEEDPLLGTYYPGDYATVWPPTDHPYLSAVAPSGVYRARIMRVSGTLGDHVTLTLAPTQENR